MENIALWIVISIIALVIDVVTSSFFFAGITVGGISAVIVQIAGGPFFVQFIVFGIVSILAIIAEYQWLRTKLKKTIPRTLKMEEEYIGRKITLDEDIEVRGKIKLEGIYWTAENIGEPVKKGEMAEIIGIKGNKLIIIKR